MFVERFGYLAKPYTPEQLTADETQRPLLALSRHEPLHRTCPLSGAKQT